MFSQADADQLRESLPAIDFRGGDFRGTECHDDSGLLGAYRDHYGLDFRRQGHRVGHRLGTIASGRFKLVCHYFYRDALAEPGLDSAENRLEDKGTAFLIHGYFDHTGLYRHLISHVLDSGYDVVIFDLPGHGLSSGPVANINSFQEYAKAFEDCLALADAQELGRPWITIGQSMGAAVIIDSLLHTDLASHFDIQRYVLLCPLLRPSNWTWGRILYALSRWLPYSTRRSFSNNSHDLEFLKFLQRDDALQSQSLPREWVAAMIDYQRRFAKAPASDIPLSIVQGSGDGTVDWRFNLRNLQKKFPNSKSYLVADAKHHLVNESPEFRSRVFTAIDKCIG
ncbi:MAG: alpha/beta hydrolase [Proteobacteria bacterium]|nr:alpha/beta hydrolase [Pseudomonadota bacterium]